MRQGARITARVLGAACTLLGPCLVPASVQAALPAEGWPQERHDERLTGQSTEPALLDPVVAFELPVGSYVHGEPVALGCDLVVASGHDRIVRINGRSGLRPWLAEDDLGSCAGPPAAAPVLSLDQDGQVVVGWSGELTAAALLEALCSIAIACESYSIDNGAYPPGVDLVNELSPWYLDWPTNPCTGLPMIVSDSASPGDVRYAPDPPAGYWLGGWWVDGAMVDGTSWCGLGTGSQGLRADWPVSARIGGTAAAVRFEDGATTWVVGGHPTGRRTWVAGLPDGFVITQEGDELDSLRAAGFLARVSSTGIVEWSARRIGGAAGQAARLASTGDLVIPFDPGNGAELFDTRAQLLSVAIESYGVDQSAYPPTGELAPLLVPTYLRSMPSNAYTGAPMRWSLVASPGDYSYTVRAGGTEYTLALWSLDGDLVSAWDTGTYLGPPHVESAAVESFREDGSPRWRTLLGPELRLSPLLITDDDAVVLAGSDGVVRALEASDGSPRWSVPVRAVSWLAPALLPDGGVVFVSWGGVVLVVDPPGVIRWELPMPASILGAPVVTSDGVILVADQAGFVTALRADSSQAWSVDAGGALSANLLTPAIPHEGLIHVGRADGVLVALAERATRGLPLDPGGLLFVDRTLAPDGVRLHWETVGLPDVLGAHYHLERSIADPRGATEHLLSHEAVETELLDPTPGLALVFYDLDVADCGENEPSP